MKLGLGSVVVLGGLLVAGGFAYHAIENGDLSRLLPAPSGSSTPPGPASANGNRYGSWSCPGPYSQLSDLVRQNPNIVGLIATWQDTDSHYSDISGASPTNWAAFRTYVTRLGYPDVGPYPVQSFCQF